MWPILMWSLVLVRKFECLKFTPNPHIHLNPISILPNSDVILNNTCLLMQMCFGCFPHWVGAFGSTAGGLETVYWGGGELSRGLIISVGFCGFVLCRWPAIVCHDYLHPVNGFELPFTCLCPNRIGLWHTFVVILNIV